MRKSFLLILITLISLSTILAQTVTVEPYGVSPRETTLSTTDLFDVSFNGLPNVGIGTKMYLKATASVALSGAQTWALATKPATSVATLGAVEAFDSTGEAIVFTPDVKGKYVVTFTDGALTGTLTINAGTYLSNTGGAVSCVTCHSSKSTEWKTTGHSTGLTKGLDGLKGDHFGPNCVSCHSTGYDKNAANDGFDDFTFVFPDTLFAGQADLTTAAYPDAMKRANIQCESCHGPGSEHIGNTADNRIAVELTSKVCATCHDSGTHHVYPAQYDVSRHANPTTLSRGSSASCAPCHSGSGFVAALKGETVVPSVSPISCVTCHDPHSNVNGNHQLRTTEVTLKNGDVITDGGYGKLCMNCHQSRSDAEAATQQVVLSSRYGPHHGPQTEMLMGKNNATFGFELPSSPHGQAVENACVGCHMSPATVDASGSVILAGGHSFSVKFPDGTDNVAACESCHGDIGTTFAEKKYYFNGKADHDGDGVAEGLQVEVEGMLEELALMLHPKGELTVNMNDKTYPYTVAEGKAAFNYYSVEEDRSMGIHNPAYTVALLKVSIDALKYGAITSGKMISVDDIMNDQGYQVRVVWTAFGADDGVATDQVESYTILRQAPAGATNLDRSKYSSFKSITNVEVGNLLDVNGELWDVVANVPAIQYIEYSAVVPTLQNTVKGDTVLSTFKVLGKTKDGIQAETTPMSGYSVDNLAPAVPENLAATIGSNNTAVLTWDEPIDEDFNYFAVYRSESQGFIPSDETIIKTTISNTFNDTEVILGKTYYYKVVAMDFSNNQSDLSAEVNLTITGIDDLENIPTAYSLNQNYPNPFNPSTTIKFGIPETANVQITIYDMVGNKVAVLVNDNLTAGYHTYNWDASNRASGIYLVQMTTNKFTKTNKMLLIK